MTWRNLELFGEKHMMHTIMFLAENPDCMKTEIYNSVSHNPRMPEKIIMLEEAGLVEHSNTDGNIPLYHLTACGYNVAKLLEEVSNKIADCKCSANGNHI